MNFEKEWYGNLLLNYFDNMFGTKVVMNCSISCGTNKFNTLDPPAFKIDLKSFDDGLYKYNFLSLNNCIDLKRSIDQVKSKFSSLETPINIVKKYNKDQEFSLHFARSNSVNVTVCRLEISHNANNFLNINLPIFPTFLTFYNLLTDFIDKYYNIVASLNQQFCFNQMSNNLSEITRILNKNNSLIESIPTTFVPQIDSNLENINKNVDKEVEENINIMNEFEERLGQDMVNIDLPVPEMKQVKNVSSNPITTGIVPYNSIFCSKVIDWKVKNLESLFISARRNEDPIGFIVNVFMKHYEDYEPFPAIDDDSFKAIFHLSTLSNQKIKYEEVLETEEIIFPTFLRNYYHPLDFSRFKSYHEELAYDLLTIYIFVELYYKLITIKSSSFISTKTEFRLSLGTEVFPFIFPILFNKSIDEIKRNVNLRMKDFKERLFVNYIKDLKEYKLNIFSDNDVERKCEEVYNDYINGYRSTKEIYEDSYLNKAYILPFSNAFNLEQIKKYIVPIEVVCCPNNWHLINEELLDDYRCSDENVRDFLLSHKKTKFKEKKVETNLDRYCKSKEDLISNEWKTSLRKLILNISNSLEDFDFKDYDYPYEELPEDIIKALYCWKPATDNKVCINYKYYLDKIKDCILSKDHILGLVKENVEDINDEDDWERFL